MAKSKSPLANFIDRMDQLRQNVAALKYNDIVVGWADESREQQRTKPKAMALAINAATAGKGLKNREYVSNFDADFMGPGRKAASLATIARVMRYGRAGGVNEKTGKKYGAIPPRDFVKVMHDKHMKPIHSELRLVVLNTLKKDAAPPSARVTLRRLGVVCKGQLQRAMMDSNAYESNAPFTIEGGWMANPINGKPFHADPKGSSRPLWNQGTLIKSVDFEIKNKG